MARNRIRDGFAIQVEAEYSRRSRELMEKDLKLSELDEHVVYAVPQPHPPMPMHHPEWVLGSYRIPYFSRDGDVMEHMYRDRLFYRPHITSEQLREAGLGKYKGPSLEAAAVNGVDARMPYLYPGGTGHIGVICEGEKKTAKAAERFGCRVLGIGGHSNWSNGGRENRRLHPDILWWVEHWGLREIVVVADPDIESNRLIAQGYNGLLMRLRAAMGDGIVRIVATPDKLDDMLVADEAFGLEELRSLDDVEGLGLAWSIGDLIHEFGLIAKTVGQGDAQRQVLIRNPYNAATLLRLHPNWKGSLRYNLDFRIMEFFGQGINRAHPHQVCETMNRFLHLPEMTVKMVSEAMETVGQENAYSPLVEELRGLPQWDGVERVKDVFGVGRDKNDVEITKAFFVGYLRRVLKPGCFWRIMVILVGRQGVGKTSMAHWLAGDHHRVALFHKGELRGGGKDLQIKLMKARIALFDDLDGFSPDEKGTLKALVTQTHAVERGAYERFQELFQRGGVMMGTSNHDDIIPDDSTGNSRFAVIRLEEGQRWEWLNEWREQILAEAIKIAESDWMPDIDWGTMTEKHLEVDGNAALLDEFLDELRGGRLGTYVIEGKRGKWWKMNAFWLWANKTPSRWEERDLKRRLQQLGLCPVGGTGIGTKSSIDREKGTDRTLKNVYGLHPLRLWGHKGAQESDE